MQGGTSSPLPEPPSCLGHWGDLRSIPPGLGATLARIGKTDSLARAEPIPTPHTSTLPPQCDRHRHRPAAGQLDPRPPAVVVAPVPAAGVQPVDRPHRVAAQVEGAALAPAV